MVLHKTKQLALVGKVSAKMKPYIFGVVMLETIIELLVVAEIKPLLL
jgi:hypothetical protein